MSLDAAIVQTATWTAAASAGYLVVSVGVAALRNRPAVARTVIGVGVAIAVAGGGVALAAPGDGGSPRPSGVSADWPLANRHHRSHSAVVRPGDSLWSIAAQRLRRPTPRRVANAWPRWWQANHKVVGRNPDLIHPGQRLRPPVTSRSRS
jgi:nucleoid-associated protein YgaU